MDKALRNILIDMRKAALEAIEIASATESVEAFVESRAVFRSSERLVSIIGEAAIQKRVELSSLLPDQPWDQIIGMRHRIIHDYRNLRNETLFEVVKDFLPRLAKDIESVLPR